MGHNKAESLTLPSTRRTQWNVSKGTMELEFPKTSSSFLMFIFGVSRPWSFSRSLFLLSLQNPGKVVNLSAVQQHIRSVSTLSLYLTSTERKMHSAVLIFFSGLWGGYSLFSHLLLSNAIGSKNPTLKFHSSSLWTCSIGMATWSLRTQSSLCC